MLVLQDRVGQLPEEVWLALHNGLPTLSPRPLLGLAHELNQLGKLLLVLIRLLSCARLRCSLLDRVNFALDRLDLSFKLLSFASVLLLELGPDHALLLFLEVSEAQLGPPQLGLLLLLNHRHVGSFCHFQDFNND